MILASLPLYCCARRIIPPQTIRKAECSTWPCTCPDRTTSGSRPWRLLWPPRSKERLATGSSFDLCQPLVAPGPLHGVVALCLASVSELSEKPRRAPTFPDQFPLYLFLQLLNKQTQPSTCWKPRIDRIVLHTKSRKPHVGKQGPSHAGLARTNWQLLNMAGFNSSLQSLKTLEP